MNSVKTLFIKSNKKYTFELFGYDFMISDEGTVYLIEVNTNPCIEESCPHLKKILLRMISNLNNFYNYIDDMLRITLDKVFPFKKYMNEWKL